MNLHWYDIAGSIGMILIVAAYFLLQSGRLRQAELRYSLLNALGAALILLSLIYQFNFSAFMVELFWLLISCYGIVKYYQRSK